LLLLIFALDGQIGVVDGAMLFALLLVYTVFLIVQSRSETQSANDEYAAEFKPAEKGGWDERLPVQLGLIVIGLAFLVLGSHWLVTAAVVFAKALGVSDVVIALTIVAAGTSMPEVATSVMAAIKGERDIAVGNVVGSSTFNLLGCVGLSGMAAGAAGLVIPASVMQFDIWVMLAVALACLPVFMTGREIARWEGGVFLFYYVAYVGYLVLLAQQHPALSGFAFLMTSFALPLTVIAMVVAMVRGTSKV
jgi:cation:H+ antiporter